MHVEITPDHWLWTGPLNPKGYGQFRGLLAHTWAYKHFVEPVPRPLHVDHACHVRHCVNLDHLRATTMKQNAENRQGPNRGSKSGYRGVHWCSQDNKRRVRVQHAGRFYSGGRFKDVEEAAEAARELRNQLFTHNDLDRMLI